MNGAPERILIVKTSSMGDLIHMLPAVSDIRRVFPQVAIDWLAEEAFADIPTWHEALDTRFVVALRRWRKQLLQPATWREFRTFRRTLSRHSYDLVLDTQGLLKSAVLLHWTRGLRAGFDRNSAREPLATRFYHRCYCVERQHHAIDRNRQLTAQALGYELKELPLAFGLDHIEQRLPAFGADPALLSEDYCVFLHATSRADKEWPVDRWQALGKTFNDKGLRVLLPWGNDRERINAVAIASALDNATVLPRLGLNDIARVLAGCRCVVGVDTGLAHLAAALDRPTVGLYFTTDPLLVGVRGPDGVAAGRQVNLNHNRRPITVSAIIERLDPFI